MARAQAAVWLAALACLCLFSGCAAARILAVTPMHAPSHFAIFTAVTKELATRGHEVTLIITAPVKGDFPPNHRVVVIGNPFSDSWKNAWSAAMLSGVSNPFNSQLRMYTLGDVMVNSTLGNPLLHAELDRPGAEYDLVLVEAFFAMEAMVAVGHKFNAPVVAIHTFGTYQVINEVTGNPVNPAWLPNPYLGFTDRMTLWQRVVNTLYSVFTHAAHHFHHLPKQQAFVSRFFPDAPPLLDLLKTRVALTLVNSHYSSFYPMPLAPNVVEVGGLHITEKTQPLPEDLQTFMDEAEDGVVYFSMGSHLRMQFIAEEKADAILWTLGTLKQKVLLKWDGPLPKLAPNIRVVDWVPQGDVMAHSKLRVFISHGGLLSTTEAVYHGVPVVGLPIFADQFFNMDVAVSKGFCVRVDLTTITRESFGAAVRDVLENPKYSLAARRLSALFRSRPQRPLDTAVFWVEHVLQHGGDHLRPSSLELSWAQSLLLDVLLLLLAPPLLLLLLLLRVCRGARRRSAAAAAATSRRLKKNK